MRVWIISDKRYGDSDEEHWIVDVAHDPRPDTDPDQESVWDRVENRGRRCATLREAIAVAPTMKSNVVNAAHIYKRCLEQVEGTSYDWTVVGDVEEVECIFEPTPAKVES